MKIESAILVAYFAYSLCGEFEKTKQLSFKILLGTSIPSSANTKQFFTSSRLQIKKSDKFPGSRAEPRRFCRTICGIFGN